MRAADRGASAHALMAMFGWLDIKQAELYTRTAERKRLARDNIHLLQREERPKLSHLGGGKGAGGKEIAKKPRKIKAKFRGWCPGEDSNLHDLSATRT